MEVVVEESAGVGIAIRPASVPVAWELELRITPAPPGEADGVDPGLFSEADELLSRFIAANAEATPDT